MSRVAVLVSCCCAGLVVSLWWSCRGELFRLVCRGELVCCVAVLIALPRCVVLDLHVVVHYGVVAHSYCCCRVTVLLQLLHIVLQCAAHWCAACWRDCCVVDFCRGAVVDLPCSCYRSMLLLPCLFARVDCQCTCVLHSGVQRAGFCRVAVFPCFCFCSCCLGLCPCLCASSPC